MHCHKGPHESVMLRNKMFQILVASVLGAFLPKTIKKHLINFENREVHITAITKMTQTLLESLLNFFFSADVRLKH